MLIYTGGGVRSGLDRSVAENLENALEIEFLLPTPSLSIRKLMKLGEMIRTVMMVHARVVRRQSTGSQEPSFGLQHAARLWKETKKRGESVIENVGTVVGWERSTELRV